MGEKRIVGIGKRFERGERNRDCGFGYRRNRGKDRRCVVGEEEGNEVN